MHPHCATFSSVLRSPSPRRWPRASPHLCAHRTHQEAAHLHEHAVALLVAVQIVVRLEVIDVDVDAPPLRDFLLRHPVAEREEIAAVVAARERIAHALLAELDLQLLP